MPHHIWLIFVFFVKKGFCHVTKAGLEFLGSSNLPALDSQSAGITGISHHTQPVHFFLKQKEFSLRSKLHSINTLKRHDFKNEKAFKTMEKSGPGN